MFKTSYFNKDVVLGLAAFIVIITLGVIVFLIVGNSNDQDTSTANGLYEIKRITAEEVNERLKAGSNLVIVDTRSKAEYERRHIAKAISIPLKEASERYTEISGYKEIILYCT